MSHDEGQVCVCVTEHRPKPNELHRHHIWPLGEGGPNIKENLLFLCPTMHANVHEFWRLYKRHGGSPPWEESRFFSVYCRQIVSIGWEMMLNAVPD